MFKGKFNQSSVMAVLLAVTILIGCTDTSATRATQNAEPTGSSSEIAAPDLSTSSPITSPIPSIFLYDEEIDGDLSDDPQGPTQFTLSMGAHSITATSTAEDLDYLSLIVPGGLVVDSIILNRYETTSDSVSMMIPIQDGATFTKPSTPTDDIDWLGTIYISNREQIGTNVLNDMFAQQGDSCFKGPIASGRYAVQAQNISQGTVNYNLSFVVTAAPANVHLPFVTTPVSVDGSSLCANIEWVQEDLGPFSLALPSDMIKEEVQGIDSFVGQYTRNEMELSFDYGAFSNSQNNYCDQPEYQESQLELSEKAARIISFTNKNQLFNSGYSYITGLYVPTVSQSEYGDVDKLGMLIQFNNAEDKAMAQCILESVSFPD